MKKSELIQRIRKITAKPKGKMHVYRALRYFCVDSISELYGESYEAFLRLCENPFLPVERGDEDELEDKDVGDEFEDDEDDWDEEQPVIKRPRAHKTPGKMFSDFPDHTPPESKNVPDTHFGRAMKELIPHMFSLGMIELTIRIERGRVIFRAVEGGELGELEHLV